MILKSALAAVIAGTAAISVAAAPALPKHYQIIKIPYCQPNADLCVESVGIHPNEMSQVVSGIELYTQKVPFTLEIHVQMWHKSGVHWIAELSHLYHKKDIPALHHKGWLMPGIKDYCDNGLWELDIHVYGHPAKGQPARSEWFAWPGKRFGKHKKDTMIATIEPHGVNSKYFPGDKIKCL